MDRYQKRVLRLREHVLEHDRKTNLAEEFIDDVEAAIEKYGEEVVFQEPQINKDINKLSKDEIIERLKEKGVDHNPRDKKEVLFNLLVGD